MLPDAKWDWTPGEPLEVADLAAFADDQASREIAILALATGIKRFDEEDLSAICQLADDDGVTLAEMLLVRR